MGELEKKGILLMADLLIPSLDFWQFKSYYFFQEIYTRMYCKLKIIIIIIIIIIINILMLRKINFTLGI